MSVDHYQSAAMLRVKTDREGRARFPDVPQGLSSVTLEGKEWRWLARDPARRESDRHPRGRYLQIFAAPELARGEEGRVELGWVAGVADILGWVRNSDGTARAGVEVKMVSPLRHVAKSDLLGRVVFDRLPAGEYSFEGGGWKVPDVALEADDFLEPTWTVAAGIVRGRVLGEKDGAPRPSRRVVLSRKIEEPKGELDPLDPLERVSVILKNPKAHVKTDAEGRFEFLYVAPGEYELKAEIGLLEYQGREIALESPSEPLEIELRVGEAAVTPPEGEDKIQELERRFREIFGKKKAGAKDEKESAGAAATGTSEEDEK